MKSPLGATIDVSAIDPNNIGQTISTKSLTVGNNITSMPKGINSACASSVMQLKVDKPAQQVAAIKSELLCYLLLAYMWWFIVK